MTSHLSSNTAKAASIPKAMPSSVLETATCFSAPHSTSKRRTVTSLIPNEATKLTSVAWPRMHGTGCRMRRRSLMMLWLLKRKASMLSCFQDMAVDHGVSLSTNFLSSPWTWPLQPAREGYLQPPRLSSPLLSPLPSRSRARPS
jgi:hypothetical protein